MSADLTVPPLPVVAWFSAAMDMCVLDERRRIIAIAWPKIAEPYDDPLVRKADADAALASLQAELKQAREVAAFMHSATRDAQEFAADAQDKAASLQARLEAAERDVNRLDWLEQKAHGALPMVRVLIMHRGQYVEHRFVRAAIDAATQEGKG